MTGSTVLPEPLTTLAGGLRSADRVARVVSLRPGRGGRPAAVLVLVALAAPGPEIVFVERAATLRTHAGQIAFPGGAADPEDRDLVATALREAEEEAGVPPSSVQVLGTLPPAHVAVSGFDVTAVVGWWRQPGSARAVDAREVASVPVVPVSDLVDPANRVSVRHPSGYTGPAFAVAGHLIWGLTGHLLDGVLELGGWSRPWDRRREVPIPARYLTGRPDPGGPDAH